MFVFAVLDRWVRILDMHLSARARLDHRQTFFFHCEFRRGRCINCKTKISVYKEQIFAKLYLLWYLMACRHGLNSVNLLRWEPSSSRTKFSSGGQMFTQTFREALENQCGGDISKLSFLLKCECIWNLPMRDGGKNRNYCRFPLQVTNGSWSQRRLQGALN